jgi:hypothetical protein
MAGLIFETTTLLIQSGFKVKHEPGDTYARVFFRTGYRFGYCGVSLTIGKDHRMMEILLLGEHNELGFDSNELNFHGQEIINCPGCMALRIRQLSGEKKTGKICRECKRHEQEKVAGGSDNEKEVTQLQAALEKVKLTQNDIKQLLQRGSYNLQKGQSVFKILNETYDVKLLDVYNCCRELLAAQDAEKKALAAETARAQAEAAIQAAAQAAAQAEAKAIEREALNQSKISLTEIHIKKCQEQNQSMTKKEMFQSAQKDIQGLTETQFNKALKNLKK